MTQFSNFAIRVLMYAGRTGVARAPCRKWRGPTAPPTITSRVAAELCRLGYLETVRGRAGGFRLAKQPEDICIGEVIRQTEGEVILVECFDPPTKRWPLPGVCQLRIALQQALAAFFTTLDRYTLADLIRRPEQLSPLLYIEGQIV